MGCAVLYNISSNIILLCYYSGTIVTVTDITVEESM